MVPKYRIMHGIQKYGNQTFENTSFSHTVLHCTWNTIKEADS